MVNVQTWYDLSEVGIQLLFSGCFYGQPAKLSLENFSFVLLTVDLVTGWDSFPQNILAAVWHVPIPSWA